MSEPGAVEAEVIPPAELPYACDVCGERFATPQQKAGHARKTGHRSPPKDSKPKGAPNKSIIESKLTELVAWAGLAVALKDPAKGQHLMKRAPAFAKAWDRAARENETVRKVLEGILTGSTIGIALAETLALLAPWFIDALPPDAAPFVASAFGVDVKKPKPAPPAAAPPKAA